MYGVHMPPKYLGNAHRIFSDNLKRGDHSEDLGVVRGIILELILEKYDGNYDYSLL
jgi:hypothetical protein